MLDQLSLRLRTSRSPRSEATPRARALAWVRANRLPRSGVPPYAGHGVATQEVTGYFIPTLLAHGERALAVQFAQWEISVQRPDGAFSAVDGVPYTFDTAQVVRGLLAVLDVVPAAEQSARRACDFLLSQIDREGRVHTPSYAQWVCADGNTFSACTDLYVLPPLRAAGERFRDARYIDAADRALEHFRGRADLTQFKPSLETISHVFGYMMEALVELGETALARKGMAQAAAMQAPDGAVGAYPGASWVCSTGLAQLALTWYRLGELARANAAVTYLESLQNPSGGFFGGYGPGASYFPDREISWAVKFYLDCLTWREGQSGTGHRARV